MNIETDVVENKTEKLLQHDSIVNRELIQNCVNLAIPDANIITTLNGVVQEDRSHASRPLHD